MKITINGSAKELTELAIALSCMENEAKKPDFPPLLTELAESENIDYIQSGCEIADTIKHTREVISSLKKMKDSAEQNEESAPQKEAAEQEYVDPIAFEESVCKFADWIRNRPGKNGKIHKYRDMKLSEFIQGDLLRADKING